MEDNEKVCDVRPDYESEYYRLQKELEYRRNERDVFVEENKILRAKLEMVYLFFGANKRVE